MTSEYEIEETSDYHIFRDALERYKEELESLKNTKDQKSIARCLQYMAEAHFGIGEVEESLASLEEALEIYRKLDNRDGMVRILDEMMYKVGDRKRSELQHMKQTILEEIGDRVRLKNFIWERAQEDMNKNNLTAARQKYLHVLELQEPGNHGELAELYSRLADVTFDIDKKLKCLEMEYQHQNDNNNSFIRCQYLEKIAQAYRGEGAFNIVLAKYMEILDILDKNGPTVELAFTNLDGDEISNVLDKQPYIGHIYLNIAEMQNLMGEPVNAIEYCEKALAIYGENTWQYPNDHGNESAFAYYQIGVIEKERGNVDAAADYFRHALHALDILGSSCYKWLNETLRRELADACQKMKWEGGMIMNLFWELNSWNFKKIESVRIHYEACKTCDVEECPTRERMGLYQQLIEVMAEHIRENGVKVECVKNNAKALLKQSHPDIPSPLEMRLAMEGDDPDIITIPHYNYMVVRYKNGRKRHITLNIVNTARVKIGKEGCGCPIYS